MFLRGSSVPRNSRWPGDAGRRGSGPAIQDGTPGRQTAIRSEATERRASICAFEYSEMVTTRSARAACAWTRVGKSRRISARVRSGCDRKSRS